MLKTPSNNEATILSLLELLMELNPKLSEFRSYMPAISHAEKIEKEFSLEVQGEK